MGKIKKVTPFILFITGISVSGKTTLYESLKKDERLSGVRFHDIDEQGVPAVGRVPWRIFRVEELLFEAVERMRKGDSTIVCGITKPHEVIESRYYDPKNNIHFLMVDISLKAFEQRIRKRIQKQEKKGEFDEVFNPDAYQELFLATKRLRKILINSTLNQKNGHLLVVENLDKKEMHDKALAIIRKIRNL